MPARRPSLSQIKAAIRRQAYDMTAHAAEEMAEDGLDINDVESAMITGTLVKTEADDPRGTRFTIQGLATDGATSVGVVGRYTVTGRFLIITVYEVMD